MSTDTSSSYPVAIKVLHRSAPCKHPSRRTPGQRRSELVSWLPDCSNPVLVVRSIQALQDTPLKWTRNPGAILSERKIAWPRANFSLEGIHRIMLLFSLRMRPSENAPLNCVVIIWSQAILNHYGHMYLRCRNSWAWDRGVLWRRSSGRWDIRGVR